MRRDGTLKNSSAVNDASTTQKYCWEAITSRQEKHPNILSIEGVAPRLSRFCVVSEWMVNGNIMEYVRKYQKVNRLDLVRLTC